MPLILKEEIYIVSVTCNNLFYYLLFKLVLCAYKYL